MANCYHSINSDDFLRFMDEPNSEDRIREEHHSIVSKQEEEIHQRVSTNLQIEGCFSYLQCIFNDPKLKNNQVIPGVSFIDGYETKRKFIFIKHPQEKDCETFWQTVWDNEVEVIVMMSKLTDKSYQYWSPNEGVSLGCEKFQVTTWQILVDSHYTLTLLCLTSFKSHERRMVIHYQYTAWPRSRFSHQPDAFVDFHSIVKDTYSELLDRRNSEEKVPPILVHSVESMENAQVFCALDICITEFDKTGMLSLPNVLTKMRERERGSINSPDLYVLCYQLVKAYLDKIQSIG